MTDINIRIHRKKSNRGTYIPKLNENINYGDRTLSRGSSCRPLGLPEERLDAMPSYCKILLYRWVLVEIVTYGRELTSFIVKHWWRTGTRRNIHGSRRPHIRYRSVSFEMCSTLAYGWNQSTHLILCDPPERMDRRMESFLWPEPRETKCW
jgi:hypothetical protein